MALSQNAEERAAFGDFEKNEGILVKRISKHQGTRDV